MSNKKEFYYTEGHEWVEVLKDSSIRVGITEYAVEQLGDVVYVELPDNGEDLDLDEEFSTVESVKSSSGIFAPVAGNVSRVNEGLEDEPELLNDSPFDEGWIIEMQVSSPLNKEKYMSESEYQTYIQTLD